MWSVSITTDTAIRIPGLELAGTWLGLGLGLWLWLWLCLEGECSG